MSTTSASEGVGMGVQEAPALITTRRSGCRWRSAASRTCSAVIARISVRVALDEVEAETEATGPDRVGGEVAVALEGEHEAAGQVVLHVLQFLRTDRLAADAPDLVEEAVDGALPMLGRGADVGGEHAGLLAGAGGDASADRVAEALFVAQLARTQREVKPGPVPSTWSITDST
jgi:hypothetical protein